MESWLSKRHFLVCVCAFIPICFVSFTSAQPLPNFAALFPVNLDIEATSRFVPDEPLNSLSLLQDTVSALTDRVADIGSSDLQQVIGSVSGVETTANNFAKMRSGPQAGAKQLFGLSGSDLLQSATAGLGQVGSLFSPPDNSQALSVHPSPTLNFLPNPAHAALPASGLLPTNSVLEGLPDAAVGWAWQLLSDGEFPGTTGPNDLVQSSPASAGTPATAPSLSLGPEGQVQEVARRAVDLLQQHEGFLQATDMQEIIGEVRADLEDATRSSASAINNLKATEGETMLENIAVRASPNRPMQTSRTRRPGSSLLETGAAALTNVGVGGGPSLPPSTASIADTLQSLVASASKATGIPAPPPLAIDLGGLPKLAVDTVEQLPNSEVLSGLPEAAAKVVGQLPLGNVDRVVGDVVGADVLTNLGNAGSVIEQITTQGFVGVPHMLQDMGKELGMSVEKVGEFATAAVDEINSVVGLVNTNGNFREATVNSGEAQEINFPPLGPVTLRLRGIQTTD